MRVLNIKGDISIRKIPLSRPNNYSYQHFINKKGENHG